MRARRVWQQGRGAVAALALVGWLHAGPAAAQMPMGGTPVNIGVACTSRPGTSPTFELSTHEGYVQLPDGNTMYMWGFSAAGQGFQHPGPVLCVNEGDLVTVVLRNTFTRPVSIIFPGQDNVLAGGVPVQPQGVGGTLRSLTNDAPPGGSVSYSFVASRPGVFLYESGTDPATQVRMGLFGALVVRPAMGPEHANARMDSMFTPNEEFMVLLSEIDPYQHEAIEAGRPFDLRTYRARYWLLNGRGFPDTMADNFAAWLPTQPYGALARIHAFNEDPDAGVNYHPHPGRAQYLNVGTENFPFHPHGNNGVVISRDGRPLEGPAGQDLSFEKFAFNIGPGQTWDVLFKWFDAERYHPVNNPVPVELPNVANQTFGMYYGGSPYLGEMGPMPPGMNTLNQCGEYYIISHNHALNQITSWGVVMTGPVTYLRIDPPLPNMCP